MNTIDVTKNDLSNKFVAIELKAIATFLTFLASELFGAVLYLISLSYLYFISAAKITAILAIIGFGSMPSGIILIGLGGYFLPKLWARFWSCFSTK